MATLKPDNATLIRGIGLIAATSIGIANMIGQGVFLKARVMTCNVGSPGMVLAVWVAAGLLALAGALTYAELAAMLPRAGGDYVYLRESYGPMWGFLNGWMQFFVARTGSQAALGIGFAIFLNILTGGALSTNFHTFNFFGHAVPFGNLQLVALASIAVVTLINCGTVSLSGHLASVLTAIKIVLVLAVGVGAFLLAQGNWSHLSLLNVSGTCEGVDPAARGGLAGFGAAMLAALWAYDGWNNVTTVAGEVKRPQRNLPLALIGGMLIVGALYVFVNLAYFYVLTPTEVASIPTSSSVATEVAQKFLGPLAISIIAAGLLFSTFGTLHTSILTGARFPYAMSRDRLFFKSLARVSPRTHVPIRALFVQALWAGVLALSGTYDALTDYVIFASWIFYGLAIGSVFVLRRKMPNAERPYRTWGYPFVPGIALIVTAWLLISTIKTSTRGSLIGLLLIALGIPVYLHWARQNRALGLDTVTRDDD